MSAEEAIYEREREAILSKGRQMAFLVGLFVLLQFVLILLGVKVFHNVRVLVWSMFGLIAVYVAVVVWAGRRSRVEFQRIREEEAALGTARRVRSTSGWGGLSFQAPRSYRSRWTFLGWPLIHIARGEPTVEPGQREIARGWIAIGERAVGLIACGGAAYGGIAFGGLAVGVFSFGGLSLGIAGLGGAVLAGWSYGGAAIGWISFGGLAIAGKLASGAFAISHYAALGAYALAPHVNDVEAQATAADSAWLHLVGQPWFPLAVPLMIVMVFLGMGLINANLRRSR